MMNVNLKAELEAAAAAVLRQAEEADGAYGIPVDPDVADFMGAFREDALSLSDVMEAGAPVEQEEAADD
ncbi:MAG: hypothetical protein LBD82_02970 [Deltaproteobacteria bacterium]|jgi:hypothetical protein|nr:hypothetical protein [Deltaproteobacteria bacterium]